MTTRELWRSIMDYGQFDRLPVIHWKGWPETRERWIAEGMPDDVDEHEYFNAVPMWAGVGVEVNLFPAFEREVLEETDEYVIVRQADGAICQDWKHRSCIPHFIDYTFTTAADWPGYKERLQPDAGRVPDDLPERVRRAEAGGLPVRVECGSMMGWIRNWMGVENMCYLLYDAPEVYADMVDTLSDLVCWGLDRVCPLLSAPADIGHGWEDICFRTGPLVSPDLFDRHVAPGYRKIRAKLAQYGTTLYSIDSDGLVEPLVGRWMEAGVNVQFPIEIGVWDADPHELRRKFGRELRIIGGFNKLVLERGRDAIDAEIDRRLPLVKEGGFVMMPDHLITPGVPLEDYKYYLNRVRELRF